MGGTGRFIFCNKDSPVCDMVLENNRLKKPQFDNFVFKTGIGIDVDIDEDHFKYGPGKGEKA